MGLPEQPFAYAVKNSLILSALLCLSSCSYRKSVPEWFAGEWQSSFEGIDIRETWQAQGDCYVGTTVWKWGSNRRVDQLKLYYNANGKLIYRVKEPKRTVEYTCEDPNNDTLIFINRKTYFPKRLIYVQPKGSKMIVWVDNEPNDPNQICFPFERVQ